MSNNYSGSESLVRFAQSSFNMPATYYVSNAYSEYPSNNRHNFDSNNNSSCAIYYGMYGG